MGVFAREADIWYDTLQEWDPTFVANVARDGIVL